MTFEEADIRDKLGMCLTADLSCERDLKVLDIMLLKGKGYQAEDMEHSYEGLKGYEDFSYLRALGELRDKFLPEEMPPYTLTDLDLLEGIVQLSTPQQISCAENIIYHLEYADLLIRKIHHDRYFTPNKVAEQMLSACRGLLKTLGEVGDD